MGISRQAIYQAEQRHRYEIETQQPVYERIVSIRRYLPRLGTRKLYHLIKPWLIENQIKLGRDGLFDWLRRHHLLIKPIRSYRKTTDSRHWLKKYPNLLENLEITRKEQVFVSDITYIESDEGVHYLSLVTDAFTRRIMGYELGKNLKAIHSIKAIQQAIRQRTSDKPLIHHSDRGVQYCSGEYQKVLRKYGIQPSMTAGYDCYQNALAERVNGILKQEFLVRQARSFNELKQMIKESVTIYNHHRPHLSLDMKTPDQVHEKASCEHSWLH